jgi:RNA polymerase sigma-70 factor (ECF subfamily)
VLLTALQDVWFRFCLSQLRGDRELAADATQETALRFLKQLASFRGESQLQTWSLSIALNVVREQRRKRQFDALENAQEPLAVTPRVGAVSEIDEEKALLKQHLDALPERQREAITLRFFEELSVEETAAAMKCATGTVKATVHQALRSLKERLKQLG